MLGPRERAGATLGLVRNGDVEEDAFVFHPGDRVDDRPQVDRVEARCHRCPYLEGERAHTARYDGGLGLRGDAVCRHPVHPESRPLRVVLVHGKTRFLTELISAPAVATSIADSD